MEADPRAISTAQIRRPTATRALDAFAELRKPIRLMADVIPRRRELLPTLLGIRPLRRQ